VGRAVHNAGRAVLRFLKRLRPSHRDWLYLLLHVLMLSGGFLLVAVDDRALTDALGSSLIATGIAGVALFIWIRNNQQLESRVQVLHEFGLKKIFKTRSTQIQHEYDDVLQGTSRNIDVMGFGLRHLREDYAADFDTWAKRAHVRILLIDPEFPDINQSYSAQREREEAQNPGEISLDVRNFVMHCSDLLKLPDKRFSIRLYKCLPSVNVFRADDTLFFGPYLVKKQSRNTPTFVVEYPGELFRVFTKHFDEIWRDPNLSRDPPAEWLR
jgi:hypothetical protein